MKSIKYLAIAFMAGCLASCGGETNSEEKEEIIDDPMETEVSADVEMSITSDDDDDVASPVETDDSDTSTSSSSSEDWDALLDSYEEYVDKYISLMKKAASGDMSAVSEYPALLEKAQDFSEKMENAQGDMTSSQWSRYMKITNKMSQAATSM